MLVSALDILLLPGAQWGSQSYGRVRCGFHPVTSLGTEHHEERLRAPLGAYLVAEMLSLAFGKRFCAEKLRGRD